jgi:hypothetical protein
MAALKCPNPTCPFLFDPTQVPPGAILTCPRCGMRFTLGPTAFQPPALPQPPVAARADPVIDDQPIFDEDTPATPSAAHANPSKTRGSATKRGRGSSGLLALAGVVMLFVVIVSAVILTSLLKRGDSDGGPANGETAGTQQAVPVTRETVYTSQLGKYRLSNYEKIWEPPLAEPKDEDVNGDLLLRGTHRKPGQSRMNLHSTAKLVVIVLDKSGDVEEANRYVRKRYGNEGTKEVDPTDFTELTDEPVGEPPPGDAKTDAPTKRLRVRPGGANADRASEKLVVYAAIKVGDDVILAEGSCSWSDRELWERRLLQLVGSLRP